jgi:hypothetical protein
MVEFMRKHYEAGSAVMPPEAELVRRAIAFGEARPKPETVSSGLGLDSGLRFLIFPFWEHLGRSGVYLAP